MSKGHFSPTEDKLIIAHRKIGVTFEAIAKILGRNSRSVSGRHERLVCHTSGRETTRGAFGRPIHEPPTRANDGSYVERCLKQGGFTAENFWRHAA